MSASPCSQQSNSGFGISVTQQTQKKMIWETAGDILEPAYRTPPCPRAGLSPSMSIVPNNIFSGRYWASLEGVLVALTATEFPAGPSVSTRFAARHIEWFPTRFPRCHGFEGSAGPKQSLEVQKLTSNPRNSPSVPGPLHVQPKNGATKLP